MADIPEVVPSRTAVRGERVLIGLVALFLAFELVHTYVRAVPLLSWPAELLNPNGVCASIARRSMEGGPIYADWRAPPHTIAPYGPLFYWLPGRIGRLVGADAFDLFRIGRGISLICTLATATLLARAVRRRGNGALFPGLLAAAAFLTATVNFPAGFDFRPDAALVFLTLAGVLVATGGASRVRDGVAIGLFVLAFLFKHTGVTGPIAVVAYRALAGERRRAVRFGVLSILALGGAFAVTALVTHGLYLSNTVSGLRAPLDVRLIPYLVWDVLSWNFGVLVVAFVLALATLGRRSIRPEAVAFLVSGVIAVAMTIRVGSAANYYVESMAFACLVVGGALAERGPAGRRVSIAALALVVASFSIRAVQILPTLPEAVAIFRARERLTTDAREGILSTARRVERLSAGRPVLCQDSSLALHLSPEAGLADWFGLSGLVNYDRFPASERIEEAIRSRAYGAIVLNRPPDSEGFTYQGMPYIPVPWSDALFPPDRAGWRRVEGSPRLDEIGDLLHRTGPRPFRFWGCPTPRLDLYLPDGQ